MNVGHDIEPLLEQVRSEYLHRVTQGDGHLLQQVEQHTAATLGKMLRPRLLLTAAATLGDEVLHSRRTLLLATCVEMIHNASLLHDDVIDRADSRRGQPSVNARWNNSVAVLVGDYLLVQIMQLLGEVGDRDVTHRVNDTVRSMVEAELLQLDNTSTSQPTNPTTYLQVIDGKTANLFALAAELGNPLYCDFGLHYGRLFQLRDDQADGELPPFGDDLIHSEQVALATIKHTLPIHI